MSDFDDHLRRWQEAGLLDPEAAGRIREFEAARGATPSSVDRGRPGVIEALVYLGLAVVGVGTFALIAQQWDELRSWARVSSLLVPCALALLTGVLLQRSGEADLRRGGQAAWLLATGLFAGGLAVIAEEYGSGAGEREALLMLSGATFAFALALWAFSPAHPQVVALGGTLAFFCASTGNWPDDYSTALFGVLLLVLGTAALALAEIGLLRPRASARLVFGLLAPAGPYIAGLDGTVLWAELLTIALGGALAAMSVVRASFTYMLVGVLTVFVGLVTFIFEHFEEELGAPVALIVSGGILLAGVLLLTQARGFVQRRRVA